jgi:hypothetical protein
VAGVRGHPEWSGRVALCRRWGKPACGLPRGVSTCPCFDDRRLRPPHLPPSQADPRSRPVSFRTARPGRMGPRCLGLPPARACPRHCEATMSQRRAPAGGAFTCRAEPAAAPDPPRYPRRRGRERARPRPSLGGHTRVTSKSPSIGAKTDTPARSFPAPIHPARYPGPSHQPLTPERGGRCRTT